MLTLKKKELLFVNFLLLYLKDYLQAKSPLKKLELKPSLRSQKLLLKIDLVLKKLKVSNQNIKEKFLYLASKPLNY
tara:strand:+ start:272 stop:499 length:228 start_codon:yes stop_codon:yes gene_type:complete